MVDASLNENLNMIKVGMYIRDHHVKEVVIRTHI